MKLPPLLNRCPIEILRRVQAVFFDIDDTFSSEGKILAPAYSALWQLRDAGITIVPVTGRPAGWCDMIARMWPVTAVIGENGAFYALMQDEKLKKIYLESVAVRRRNAQRLLLLKKEIEKKFRGMTWASDQAFREFDLAIDCCEDVVPWSEAKVQKLLDFCRRKGALAKLSSIHVNTWFGQYDKWSCAQRVIKDVLKLDPKKDLHKLVYLGDSPNDEPFFAQLPFTVGVANVTKFIDKIERGPSFITTREGGLGFEEFVKHLLTVKRA